MGPGADIEESEESGKPSHAMLLSW
jgi:hypothetical protein